MPPEVSSFSWSKILRGVRGNKNSIPETPRREQDYGMQEGAVASSIALRTSSKPIVGTYMTDEAASQPVQSSHVVSVEPGSHVHEQVPASIARPRPSVQQIATTVSAKLPSQLAPIAAIVPQTNPIIEATEEANIINSHPIKEGLVAFRHQFESSRARLGFVGSSGTVENIISAESTSEHLILDLIEALQTLPAARVLHSQIDRKASLRVDLFSLGSKVGSSDFDIKSAFPLVTLVIDKAPDVEIWRAVFDLVALTNPTAFKNVVFDTPLRSSSASRRWPLSGGIFSSPKILHNIFRRSIPAILEKDSVSIPVALATLEQPQVSTEAFKSAVYSHVSATNNARLHLGNVLNLNSRVPFRERHPIWFRPRIRALLILAVCVGFPAAVLPPTLIARHRAAVAAADAVEFSVLSNSWKYPPPGPGGGSNDFADALVLDKVKL